MSNLDIKVKTMVSRSKFWYLAIQIKIFQFPILKNWQNFVFRSKYVNFLAVLVLNWSTFWYFCHSGQNISVSMLPNDQNISFIIKMLLLISHKQGPDLYAFIGFIGWWWWYKLIININIWLLICNTYYRTMFNTYNWLH